MKIYLRPVKEEDGRLIVKWRNAPKVAAHCFNRDAISIESNRKFFEDHVKTDHYKQFIVERIDEDYGIVSFPIATVYLKDVDKVNKRCELCIFTSDDEEWNTESQAIAIRELLTVAFSEIGMHKVYSYVFTKFEDEKELLERAGFKAEAVLEKEALGPDGTYSDAYRMVIFEKEYKSKSSETVF